MVCKANNFNKVARHTVLHMNLTIVLHVFNSCDTGIACICCGFLGYLHGFSVTVIGYVLMIISSIILYFNNETDLDGTVKKISALLHVALK